MIRHVLSTIVPAWPRQASAAATLHAVPAVVLVIAVLVTGLVALTGKYLFFYASNRRARSIADIRQAAIEGKISASDAEKLIQADVEADSNQKLQVADGDETGKKLGDSGPSALSAASRVILILRHVHLL